MLGAAPFSFAYASAASATFLAPAIVSAGFTAMSSACNKIALSKTAAVNMANLILIGNVCVSLPTPVKAGVGLVLLIILCSPGRVRIFQRDHQPGLGSR